PHLSPSPTRRSSDLIATVTAPGHAEPIRIDPALSHREIKTGHDVLEVLTAPVAVDRGRERPAVSGAAARIGNHDGVTVRRQQLRSEEHTSELQSLAY